MTKYIIAAVITALFAGVIEVAFPLSQEGANAFIRFLYYCLLALVFFTSAWLIGRRGKEKEKDLGRKK